MEGPLEALVSRLEAVTTRLEALVGSGNSLEFEKSVDKADGEESFINAENATGHVAIPENSSSEQGTSPLKSRLDVRYFFIQIIPAAF